MPTSNDISERQMGIWPEGNVKEPNLRYQGLWAHCQILGSVFQHAIEPLDNRRFALHIEKKLPHNSRIRAAVGLPYVGGSRVCSLSGTVSECRELHPDEPADRSRHKQLYRVIVKLDEDTEDADLLALQDFLQLWHQETDQKQGAD